MEKKLDGNYTRMLRAVLNKSWRQHLTKQQLHSDLPTHHEKLSKLDENRHEGTQLEKLISDVLLWSPSHGTSKGRMTSSNLHTAALCRYGM